jgi:hypothetical protein
MRRALFDFLSTIDLKPIEWSEAVALTSKLTPFVGEILDTAMQHAQAIVVLFPVTTRPGYGWRLFLRVQHHSLLL